MTRKDLKSKHEFEHLDLDGMNMNGRERQTNKQSSTSGMHKIPGHVTIYTKAATQAAFLLSA